MREDTAPTTTPAPDFEGLAELAKFAREEIMADKPDLGFARELLIGIEDELRKLAPPPPEAPPACAEPETSISTPSRKRAKP